MKKAAPKTIDTEQVEGDLCETAPGTSRPRGRGVAQQQSARHVEAFGRISSAAGGGRRQQYFARRERGAIKLMTQHLDHVYQDLMLEQPNGAGVNLRSVFGARP